MPEQDVQKKVEDLVGLTASQMRDRLRNFAESTMESQRRSVQEDEVSRSETQEQPIFPRQVTQFSPRPFVGSTGQGSAQAPSVGTHDFVVNKAGTLKLFTFPATEKSDYPPPS